MLKKTFYLILFLGFFLGLGLVAAPRAKAATTYSEDMRSGAFSSFMGGVASVLYNCRDARWRNITQGDCARSIFFTLFSAAIYTVGIAGTESGKFRRSDPLTEEEPIGRLTKIWVPNHNTIQNNVEESSEKNSKSNEKSAVWFSQDLYTPLNVDVDKDNEYYRQYGNTRDHVPHFYEFELQDGDGKPYQTHVKHVYNAETGDHHLEQYGDDESSNSPGARRTSNDRYTFTYKVNGLDSQVRKNLPQSKIHQMAADIYGKLLEMNADKTCVSFEGNLRVSQLLYGTLQVTNADTEGMLTADKCAPWAVDMPYEWSYYYTLRDEL